MAVAEQTRGTLSAEQMRERLPHWRNDAAAWASDVVWIQKPDGSIGPIELYPGQRDFLREASRREPHPQGLGRPIHKTAVASRPKRNNKSIDAAILCAHSVALFTRRTSGVVANSQDQARSVTFDYVADVFDYSPGLQGLAYYGTMCLDGRLQKRPEVTTIAIPSMGNEVRAMVPNVRTIQGRGINGTAVIEELQAAYSEEAFALLASQTEATSAQIIIASQAGHREGALWRLYRSATNQGGDNPRIWFDYWGDEDALVANRAPWVTPEFLADAELNMAPWEFSKYHLNLWGGGAQAFLAPELIDSLFAVDYPLAAVRVHDRKAERQGAQGSAPLRTASREDWQALTERMGWKAWAVGIGLDRAMPYAQREGTCVSATLKAAPSGGAGILAGPVVHDGNGGPRGNAAPPTATAEPHHWEIASIDCPNGSQAEIDEACDAIETTIGRRVTARAYESYQSSDIAEEHGADLVTPTSARQRVMFNRFHQLTREGRHHCSPQSAGLRHELEEFTVDTTRAQPRFEHPSSGTDDRIYARGYSLEAVVDETVMDRRFGPKPRGM